MFLLFLMFGSVLFGAEGPRDSTTVSRYGPKDLIPVRTKVRFTTLIMLPPGYKIAEVSCGDTTFFVIDGKDNILHIKPARQGVATNLNIVLQDHSVYSFFVQEVGDKGEPDLKVVMGPEEVHILRDEKRALETKFAEQERINQRAAVLLREDRARDLLAQQKELEQAKEVTPERTVGFLASLKSNYACYQKTSICLAGVFATSKNTYVIGKFVALPSFVGTDTDGHYHSAIAFERSGNVYRLAAPLQSVTVSYLGKSVFVSLH